MKHKKFGLAALAAISVFALAACSGGANSAGKDQPGDDEVIKIRIQGQPSIAAEPMYIALEEGYFEEEGLEVEVVDLPDAAAAFAALQAGQLELGFSPTIGVLQAARQNLPLVLVAPSDGLNPDSEGLPVDEAKNFTSSGVYVSAESGITDISGLAGASIAVPELKSQPDATITSVLQEAGHKTDGIEWLNLSFVPALDALKNGTLDAAFLVSPYTLEADGAGLKRVMNPSVEFFPAGSATSAWVGTQKWATENPVAVERFQRALAKAAESANENLTQTKEHAIARSSLTVKPEDMPQSYWPSTFDQAQLADVDKKLMNIGFFDQPLDINTVLIPSAG